MDGYLVMLRMANDDLPLRLFKKLEEAQAFVSQSIDCDGEPTEEFIKLCHETLDVLNYTHSHYNMIDVLQIVNGYMSLLAGRVVFND